jgi:hypothetical protein
MDKSRRVDFPLVKLRAVLERYLAALKFIFALARCAGARQFMRGQIMANLDEFMNGGFILDFERKWVEKIL